MNNLPDQITCRHYATVQTPRDLTALNDPDHLLEQLGEHQWVTLVFDVDRDRALWLRSVYPLESKKDGMATIRRLKAEGVRLWFPEDHAAYTDQGWLDVEALGGEPMTEPHSS